MGWDVFTRLLDEMSNHSTFVGKIWLTFFIVFRILLTVVGCESVYVDERSNFVCKTQTPGCENVCYDAFEPLRFWVFQVIMIITPTVIYLGFAIHKKRVPIVNRGANRDYKETEDNGEEDPMNLKIEPVEEKEVSKKHKNTKTKFFQLISRAVYEISFLFGQYILYGLKVAPSYVCTSSPCSHTVDCFVSRPTEKTIFLRIMYAISALCLLLTLLEILHLWIGGIQDCLCRPRPRSSAPHHPGLARRRPMILQVTTLFLKKMFRLSPF
ncbi:gap junction gamma-1 protein-like [Fundulus diaphanus]